MPIISPQEVEQNMWHTVEELLLLVTLCGLLYGQQVAVRSPTTRPMNADAAAQHKTFRHLSEDATSVVKASDASVRDFSQHQVKHHISTIPRDTYDRL